jgi:hypothetical protein
MQYKLIRDEWRKTLWKIVSNPTVEVVAVLLVVALAAWEVLQMEGMHRGPAIPVLQGNK